MLWNWKTNRLLLLKVQLVKATILQTEWLWLASAVYTQLFLSTSLALNLSDITKSSKCNLQLATKKKKRCRVTVHIKLWWVFPHVRGFGENVRQFIPCLHFFFFFKVEISSHKLVPLFRQKSVHGGSASWDNCDWVFLDELRVSSFLDRFPHSAWTVALLAHSKSNFIGSRVYACLALTCHQHFWQNDQGLSRATAVTRVWNGHRIRVSTQS